MVTVSVAALVRALPPAFVNTARYSFPDWARVVDGTVSVDTGSDRAVKARGASVVDTPTVTSVHALPRSVETCHTAVNGTELVAAAVKIADVPTTTV